MKNSKMEIRDLFLKLVLIYNFYHFHYYFLGLFRIRKKRKMGVITSLDESDQEQPTEYKTKLVFYIFQIEVIV
jgi:phosphoribosylaminoimidazole carboxylase (NCAIR synthetase)